MDNGGIKVNEAELKSVIFFIAMVLPSHIFGTINTI